MVGILLASLVYSGYALGQGLGFAVLSCGGTLLHTVWQLATWDESNLKDHRAKFEVSARAGSAARTPPCCSLLMLTSSSCASDSLTDPSALSSGLGCYTTTYSRYDPDSSAVIVICASARVL